MKAVSGKKLLLAIFLSFSLISQAEASELGREKYRMGVYASVSEQPYPSALGMNFGYFPIPLIKLSAGLGYTFGRESAISYGTSLQFYVLPSNISLFLGVSYALIQTSGTIRYQSFLSSNTATLSGSQSVIATQIGVGSVDSKGFYWSFGLHYPLSANLNSVPLPGGSIGYFF